MMTEPDGILQTLVMLSLVLSAQIVLVLLLRKPVRRYLGAIACYRLWLVALLWLPGYLWAASCSGGGRLRIHAWKRWHQPMSATSSCC